MKKLLVVLLALTALSVAAFADDVVWTWGLTVKTGAQFNLGDSTSVPSPTIIANDADDPTLSRIRFDADAALGDFSAHARINSDLAGFDVPLVGVKFDNWWVNAYFVDKMIQLQFGALDHAVTDTVNNGWGGLNGTGAQVVVTPMSGLNIGLFLPVPGTATPVDTEWAGLKAGVAFTMPDLVTVKATWMNAGGTNLSDAAFGVAVLAVPNLTAQLEVLDTDVGNAASVINVFENVAYVMGALTPSLAAQETLYSTSGLNTEIWIKPAVDYLAMTGLNLGASVKYTMNVAGGTTSALVVDPYVKVTFNDKAKVKIDAAYTIPNLSATSTWSLPININFMYSF